MYMTIAAEKVRATVDIIENIDNHLVYSNSNNIAIIMEDNTVSTYKKFRRTIQKRCH